MAPLTGEDLRRYKQDRDLRRRHGITLDDYNALLLLQGGVCAICGQPETTIDRRHGTLSALAVDHDHATGLIRGLLCRCCNRGIGLLQDNAAVCRAAATYIDNKATTMGLKELQAEIRSQAEELRAERIAELAEALAEVAREAALLGLSLDELADKY